MSASAGADRLTQRLFGVDFQNPVLLAAGTCGYGRELAEVVDLESLGGLVTKAITPEPRAGNAPLRVAEFSAGMLNSVGLANVGVEAFRSDALPWLAAHVARAQVLVNVAGKRVEDYPGVVARLDPEPGFLGFELNVSCPNVKEGGAIFCARDDLLREVVAQCRAVTRRPLLAKLAPNLPDVAHAAEVAVAAGADGITVINTFPGLLFDVESRRALLGAGTGGVSGPAVLPMGVHAVWSVRRRVDVPVVGVGGVRGAEDALQYLLAGASLVQIGTAGFADPRAAHRVLNGLDRYLRRHAVGHVGELVGAGITGSGTPT